MYYYIKKDGSEYIRTADALLACNLFTQMCQSGVKDVDLLFGQRLFASSKTIRLVKNGK